MVMSKHRLNTQTTEDEWLEILARLPVKALLRFRSVCKTWRSLIDDPNFFCRLHLNSFNNNKDDINLLVTEYCGYKEPKLHLVRSSHTLETMDNPGYPYNNQSPLYINWYIICSTDGLVMLQSRLGVILWNPSIRKSRTLPPPPIFSKGMKNVNLGLGFDPLINDYKHVTLICHEETKLVDSITVYTVGSGCWKTSPSNWPTSLDSKCNYLSTVCFNGVLYFITKHPSFRTRELVAFDLSNEVFASLSLPKVEYDDRIPCFELVNSRKSLVLSYFNRIEESIWVSEIPKVGIGSMNWSKRYRFVPRMDGFESFFWMRPDCLYYLKKNDKLLVQGLLRRATWYDLESGEGEIVNNESGDEIVIIKNVVHYVESLVLING